MTTTPVLARHAVRVQGNLQAPQAMVFVHGLGTEQSAWAPVATAFAATHRLVLFDNAGAGRADPAAFVQHKYLGLGQYADDLLAICAALDLREAVFVGHSAGAMIAALAAVAEPARCAKLVLIGASPRYLDDRDYRGGMTDEQLAAIYSAVVDNFDQWAETIASMAMAAPDQPDLARYFAATLRAIPPDRAFTVLCSILQSDSRPLLPRIAVPTLLLQTRDDIFVPLEVAHYLERMIPHSTLRVVEAQGHFPHLSAPATVIAAMQAFLAV